MNTRVIDTMISDYNASDPLSSFRRYIKKFDKCVIIDIGANVGDLTVPFAMEASLINGKVIAVEPGPKAFACLTNRVQNFPHVTCIRAALSDRTNGPITAVHQGHWTLLPPDHKLDNRYFLPYIELKEVEPFTVEVLTTDQVVSILNIEPTFIKIDVDGWELRVLRGSLGCLRKHRPFLVVEVCNYTMDKVGDSSFELGKLLLDENYLVTLIPNPVVSKIPICLTVPSDIANITPHDAPISVDLLCIPVELV
jgi:FkbM family methyltransferase